MEIARNIREAPKTIRIIVRRLSVAAVVIIANLFTFVVFLFALIANKRSVNVITIKIISLYDEVVANGADDMMIYSFVAVVVFLFVTAYGLIMFKFGRNGSYDDRIRSSDNGGNSSSTKRGQ